MTSDEIRARFRAKCPIELATGNPVYFTGWSEDLFVRLAGIHACMRNTRWVSDMEQFGVSDKIVASYLGDCDDKVTRALLDAHEAGIPMKSMRVIRRGWYWGSPPHVALCLYVVIRGVLRQVVLDNTQAFLMDRHQLRGTWIEI